MYPNFEEKISAVQGDILDPNFGLNATDECLLIEHCHVVFHSAATVRFHEPLTVNNFIHKTSSYHLLIFQTCNSNECCICQKITFSLS